MSWKNDSQRAAVARSFLATVRLGHLWTEEGPTKRAVELLESGGGPLSAGEALMLRIAFDAWNGEGKADLGDMLATFDPRRLQMVGALLVYLARNELDDWLDGWGVEA